MVCTSEIFIFRVKCLLWLGLFARNRSHFLCGNQDVSCPYCFWDASSTNSPTESASGFSPLTAGLIMSPEFLFVTRGDCWAWQVLSMFRHPGGPQATSKIHISLSLSLSFFLSLFPPPHTTTILLLLSGRVPTMQSAEFYRLAGSCPLRVPRMKAFTKVPGVVADACC